MTIEIFDASEFQTINWPAVSGPGIVRVHNGGRPDYKAQQNIAGARAYCPWRGWYQYQRAGDDPATAARAFAATLGPLLAGEVMILDLEEGGGDQRGRRQAWYDALPGVPKWTYAGLAFARAHLPGITVEWIAAYGQGEPTDPHTLWQHTNAQRFAGIAGPCDASVFHGDLAALIALTGATPTPTPASTVTQEDDMLSLILYCYTALVGRTNPPSTSEVENWISGTGGWTSAQVLAAFLGAPAEPGAVAAAYRDFLHREPESQAVIDQRLAGRPTIRQVRYDIANSPEARG